MIRTAPADQIPTLLEMLNNELAGLTVDDIEKMRADPARMASFVTKGRYRLWKYNRILSQKFKDAAEGRSRFQIWNMPARYGKSFLASKWGPVWLLETRPEARIILTSYGFMLAKENATFVRNTLEAHPDVFTTRLMRDRRAADRFVTKEGGGVLAAGVGGSITGFGAGDGGGIIVDDPHKNWMEAHSEIEREKVWTHYLGTLRLRLDDETAFIIVVQTRWHEEDLSGKLLAQTEEEWELVRLPAIAEEYSPDSDDPFLRIPDPLGRKPGEPLEPERFAITEVQARARALGSYLAAGLEQQRPAPAEGGEIKRAWWKWTSNLPTSGDQWVTSWDMKLKEKESGDYVVGQCWSRTGASFFCHAQLRGQWTMLKTACAIALLGVRFPAAKRHLIENTGNGPEVMEILRAADPTAKVPKEYADDLAMTPEERKAVQETLRRGLPGLLPINPRGDKRARARIVSGIIEGGNVWLPEGRDWALFLVNEAAAFPHGAHDDTVDAWSQGLAYLSGRMRRAAGPGGDTQTSNWK